VLVTIILQLYTIRMGIRIRLGGDTQKREREERVVRELRERRRAFMSENLYNCGAATIGS